MIATNNPHRTQAVALPSRMEKLIRDLGATRAENTRLKASLSRQNRYSSIVYRAVTDAHTLVCAAFAGESTSKGAMAKEGISQRRWEWAVAFLRYAGIVATVNADWRAGLTWRVTLLDEAVRLLEKSAHELNSSKGYRRLRTVVKHRRKSW